jgi:hypothetical protein
MESLNEALVAIECGGEMQNRSIARIGQGEPKEERERGDPIYEVLSAAVY